MNSITVAICTYNNPGALRTVLRSLQAQKVTGSHRWSVLVVDNNSPRATAPVVNEFLESAAIPGLRLVSEPRQGLSFARRRAVLECDTELVAFVDDDCVLDPDWIERAVSFCTAHPAAGAVGGRISLDWEEPPADFVALYSRAYAWQDYGEEPQQAPPRAVSFLAGAGLVLRRSAVLRSRWLDEFLLVDRTGSRVSSGGDSELVLRIRLAGYEVWYTPDLHLRHTIPARRATLPYLFRLSRSFGQSEPAIFVIARSSVWARLLAPLLFLGSGVGQILRHSSRLAIGTIRQRTDEATFARIALHRHVGRITAALTLLGQNPLRRWRRW